LYLAMVDDVFKALEQPLKELHRQQHDSVRDFVRAYMQFLSDNPWWPNFVVREVLFGEEVIRQSIIEKFSAVFARRLVGAVAGEIESGHYRSDLKPELAAWSLLGMMVFPFLSRPIARHLLEAGEYNEMMDTLIEHTTDLFERGVQFREKT
ncbi:MAG: CerR family C-terminal domain-containing protein, partial [Pseudomonadales bacterium]|nr:CerR family C-terminal domain-containing protein [Pseudomonadales bacterium]